MTFKHTAQEYDGELRKIREQLLLMGAKVEEMIAGGIKSLLERDSELAHRMIELDNEVNKLEVDIDELCLRVLARRQPVASDLRAITTAIKMVTDLERIGDLAVNICERAIELNMVPPLKPYVDLPHMAEIAQEMVRSALDAFVNRDAEQAEQVIEKDQPLDFYYGQIFREVLTYMLEDARNIYRATKVQSIAKYLERIGDHATNLAEMVVFMVKATDIRHAGRLGNTNEPRIPRGVLFVCVENSVQSQMAEGLARKFLPSSVRILSAGLNPANAIHPLAIQVMKEIGIDISAQRPKGFSDIPMGDVDTVVRLCSKDECSLPGNISRRIAWPLMNPASTMGSEEEMLSAFRDVRDELRKQIGNLKSF
jgi:phosphate transport system protein